MEKSKKENKLSIADLKAKAGKAFLDVNAIKGGDLAGCHIVYDPTPPIVKTDAV